MSQSRPTMVAVLTARPGQTDGLKAALLRLVANSRNEAGMVQYDLHQLVEHSDKFAFYEIWADEAAFEAHKNSAFMVDHRKRIEPYLASVERMPLIRLTD